MIFSTLRELVFAGAVCSWRSQKKSLETKKHNLVGFFFRSCAIVRTGVMVINSCGLGVGNLTSIRVSCFSAALIHCCCCCCFYRTARKQFEKFSKTGRVIWDWRARRSWTWLVLGYTMLCYVLRSFFRCRHRRPLLGVFVFVPHMLVGLKTTDMVLCRNFLPPPPPPPPYRAQRLCERMASTLILP